MVVLASALKTFDSDQNLGSMGMYKNGCGKLLVTASTDAPHKKRLQSVKMATEEMAKLIHLDVEIKQSRKSYAPIYVYYENGDDEPVPIYCDEGKTFELPEICTTLRNMMFVLSFHPKNSALKQVRNAFTVPS